jgi:hypothetical protein
VIRLIGLPGGPFGQGTVANMSNGEETQRVHLLLTQERSLRLLAQQ